MNLKELLELLARLRRILRGKHLSFLSMLVWRGFGKGGIHTQCSLNQCCLSMQLFFQAAEGLSPFCGKAKRSC
jgi:hypothetical protein